MSPLPEQTVGSVFAENHLTVDFGGDLECNLARSVRCDDIGTRRLRRDDQMDTSRAGHFCVMRAIALSTSADPGFRYRLLEPRR